MSIRASCPGCAKRYEFPDEAAGRKVQCKACGEVFGLPSQAITAKRPEPEDLREEDDSQEDAPAKKSLSTKDLLALIGIVAVLAFIAIVVVTVSNREPGHAGEQWTLSAVVVGFIVVASVWSLVPAYMCERMGRERACGGYAGFFVGIFFGWFGLLIVPLSPYTGKQRKCPDCAEKIKAEARVCKHCGKQLKPMAD